MTTDDRKTVEELLRGIQHVFKNSSRAARVKAWSRLTSSKGRIEIDKLINNPDRSIGLFKNLISFKEWINEK